MNAYELADELDRIAKVSMPLHYITESANRLRQQADRIAELERLVSDMIYEKSSGVYDRPQIKELSDEEIWEVIDNCFGVHAFNLDYQIALDEAREDAFDLVKTILKKASEK